LTIELMRWAAMRRFGWWEIGRLGLHFVGHVGHRGGPGGAEIVGYRGWFLVGRDRFLPAPQWRLASWPGAPSD
jgi:glutamate synthase domain-containing protein 1